MGLLLTFRTVKKMSHLVRPTTSSWVKWIDSFNFKNFIFFYHEKKKL